MKNILRALLVLSLFAIWAPNTFSQTSERESFDRKLYSVVPLGHFGTSPKQFAELTPNDRMSLMASHDVLIALFQAMEKNSDISKFLTPELFRKYKNAASLVDPETELSEVGVFDWQFVSDKKNIELYFLTVVYSEGVWVLSKNVAVLRGSGSAWRVSELRLYEN